MAYTADSFTAGEQPTTSKWNELWANDASFHDGTGIANNAIVFAHLAAAIFSGQLTTYSTGGTFKYGNIGGLKIFMGVASPISITGTGVGGGTITFPTSFFSSVITGIISSQPGTDVKATVAINTLSTTALVLYAWNTGGTTSTATPWVLVIGT